MIIVTRDNFDESIRHIGKCSSISIDTETTGLRPWHGDKLFAISLGTTKGSYYFDFRRDESVPEECQLSNFELEGFRKLCSHPDRFERVFFHNAKFDLAFLQNAGIYFRSKIYDTKTLARLYDNSLTDYSLASLAAMVGEKKGEEVEAYIEKHKLYTVVKYPHKQGSAKNKHFDKVPFSVMSVYAAQDAKVTLKLGSVLYEKTPLQVRDNESKLTPILHKMQDTGVLVDLEYCKSAAGFYSSEMKRLEADFITHTGQVFKLSNKILKEILKDEELIFNERTATGQVNPDFSTEVLETFKHPVAKTVVEWRHAKSQANYFKGFIYHADEWGIIHSNLNSDGTVTGRFSSSDPNLQNCVKEDGSENPYPVRRAIIPRPEYFFAMFDMDQAEYRLMLDYACTIVGYETPLVKSIKEGLDVHEATAQIAGITRKEAKSTNFCVLYGGGDQKLADLLGTDKYKAKAIKAHIFNAAPEIKYLIEKVRDKAKLKRQIHNWLGRIYQFKFEEEYKAPNTLIQGGVADIVKVGMVKIDEFLAPHKSRLVLNIHDELVIETHKSEKHLLPEIKKLLESVYPAKFLPLTFGCDHSFRSLGDKVKGYPNG